MWFTKNDLLSNEVKIFNILLEKGTNYESYSLKIRKKEQQQYQCFLCHQIGIYIDINKKSNKIRFCGEHYHKFMNYHYET